MTCRGNVTTYKALERDSNRAVVVKVIKKSEENLAFHSALLELEKCDSPYLVRYLKCYKDEHEYTV